MSLYHAKKVPHPVQSQATADTNRQGVCEKRGYCGPFVNEEYYANFPDPSWWGMGECVVCCNTCNIAAELDKKARVELGLASSPAAESSAGEPTPEM